jgi:hypothetical protein
MTAVVTSLFHPNLANSVYEEIQNRGALYHYFVGEILSWDDETSPPAPSSVIKYENRVRNNIVQTKQIQINDVAFVVPRINWELNEVYDMFDDTYSSTNLSSTGADSLKSSRFYVLTQDFNVYKCIYNNNGAPSTVEPSGTSSNYLETSDGYVWKFMSFIPLGLRNKFLTSSFFPIIKNVKNRYYSQGVIDSYTILSGGQNYDPNETYAVITGDGSGPYAERLADPVTHIVEYKDGSNQYGVGKKFYIDNQIAPKLHLVEGNTYRFDQSHVSNNGIVLKFSTTLDGIHDTGSEYTTGVVYNGTPGTPNAYTEITLEEGVSDLYYYNDTDEYSGNKAYTIGNRGYDGSANIQLIIESGEITGLEIIDGGYGYTTADLVVAKDDLDPGSGANITVNLSEGDLDTQQANVELLAVDGEISYIVIENSGQGYTNAAINIEGDGAGADFSPVINSAGEITGITINNQGSGYSYANVTITGDGRNATARAIMSPLGGHGYNAPDELLSDTLCFYSSFDGALIEGLAVNNEFRQIGIIKNLKEYDSIHTKFNNVLGSACFVIAGSFIGDNYPEDSDIITDGSTKTLRVVTSIDNSMLVQSLDGSIPQIGEVYYDSNSLNPFTISNITRPSINKFSGNMLYIDNKQAFQPSLEQSVIFRTFIKY